MKDINIFSKALAAKGVFRIISTEDLWQEVMRKKYIAPGSTGELIRKPSKQGKGGSIAWKALMTEYHLIGDYLAWLIGNGQRVRLGQIHGLGALTQTDYHRTSFTIFIPGTANILQMFMTGISMVYGIPGEEMWNS